MHPILEKKEKLSAEYPQKTKKTACMCIRSIPREQIYLPKVLNNEGRTSKIRKNKSAGVRKVTSALGICMYI